MLARPWIELCFCVDPRYFPEYVRTSFVGCWLSASAHAIHYIITQAHTERVQQYCQNLPDMQDMLIAEYVIVVCGTSNVTISCASADWSI